MFQQPSQISSSRMFGLVHRNGSDLLLSRSRLPLAPVLNSVQRDMNEETLLREYPGLQADEIRAVRAYLVRFGPDAKAPTGLPEGPKALLLDENIPYTLLPLVVEYFGWSSHVEAEGLSRQNLAAEHQVPRSALDSRIARFAAANNFAGIVTADTDFIDLYNYPNHPVRSINVILIDPRDTTLSVERRLVRQKDMINRQLAAPTPRLVRI